MICSDLTLWMNGDVCGSALLWQGLWTVWVKSSQISWIRHLGAMWAWPALHGCTGMAWDVTDVGARAFFRTAGIAGTAGAWFIWVASVAGVGCICCAGGGGAGCTAEKQCLIGACGVAVVPLSTVSTTLTMHSWRCLHVWRYVEPLLVHTW